jgi:hypothetical protein
VAPTGLDANRNVPGSRGPAGGDVPGVPPQDLCIHPAEQAKERRTHKSEEVLPVRPRHQEPSKPRQGRGERREQLTTGGQTGTGPKGQDEPRKGRGVRQASPGRCPQRDQPQAGRHTAMAPREAREGAG